MTRTSQTLAELLHRTARRDPRKHAVVCGEPDFERQPIHGCDATCERKRC